MTIRKIKREDFGLVRLRKQTAKEPTYKCDNCNCTRYSPCGCQKKA